MKKLTPKSEANRIVKRFMDLQRDKYDLVLSTIDAKRQAIVAIEEIRNWDSGNLSTQEFWDKALAEIKRSTPHLTFSNTHI